MNLIQLQDFFADYSISSIIMAVFIYLAVYFIDKHTKSKVVKGLTYFLPFALGLITNFVYNLILHKKVVFNSQLLSAGLMTGCLSLVIKVIINRVLKGEKLPDSKLALLISGLIEGQVEKERVIEVANLIEKITLETGEIKTECEIICEIEIVLSKHALKTVTEQQIKALATLIFASVNQTKE